MISKLSLPLVATMFVCFGFFETKAFGQSTFYQGKTITVIASTAPGPEVIDLLKTLSGTSPLPSR